MCAVIVVVVVVLYVLVLGVRRKEAILCLAPGRKEYIHLGLLSVVISEQEVAAEKLIWKERCARKA